MINICPYKIVHLMSTPCLDSVTASSRTGCTLLVLTKLPKKLKVGWKYQVVGNIYNRVTVTVRSVIHLLKTICCCWKGTCNVTNIVVQVWNVMNFVFTTIYRISVTVPWCIWSNCSGLDSQYLNCESKTRWQTPSEHAVRLSVFWQLLTWGWE